MSRKLTSVVVLLSYSAALAASAVAQDRSQTAEPGRARLERPPAANLQIEPVDPELRQLLQSWSDASAQIEKLQGKHRRFVFDHVFGVEKRAEGVFYYEAPDKGRIDLSPATIRKTDQSTEKRKDGTPYKIEADHPQRWICTGTEIWQVRDTEKTVNIFPIPPDAQGANIMDGPLPFLFGMPPDKALLRYKMQILGRRDALVYLAVQPRTQQDLANWKEATVILNTTRWLPEAVKLVDPSGNLVTVYSFYDVEPNKQQPFAALARLFGGDPNVFQPKLAGYRRNLIQGKAVAEAPQAAVVPAVINFRWKDAQALLQKAGYEAKALRGEATDREQLIYVVYEQDPRPGTPLPKGQAVRLTLYDRPAEQSR